MAWRPTVDLQNFGFTIEKLPFRHASCEVILTGSQFLSLSHSGKTNGLDKHVCSQTPSAVSFISDSIVGSVWFRF